MKFRFIAALMTLTLILTTFSGCAPYAIEAKLDAAEDAFERSTEQVEEKVESAVRSAVIPKEAKPQSEPKAAEQKEVTSADAEKIALEHSGVNAEDVKHLYAQYEIDDRIPKFDVSFWADRVEYEYEIHAETGEILSFETDR